MCKHTVAKTRYISELWALQRCKTAKVTFSLNGDYW